MHVTVQDVRVPEQLRLVLISDSDTVAELVAESCPPPHEILQFPLGTLLDSKGFVTERLSEIMEEARTAHAVVIEWGMRQAPYIGVVGYHVRTVPPPLIAICHDGEDEEAAALVIGADDVWTVPLSEPLLRAKILAHLRSLAPFEKVDEGAPAGPEGIRRVGSIGIDRRRHRFYVRNEEIRLTPRQFAMASYLVDNEGALVTREQILEDVWGIGFDIGTNVVDVYIHYIRRLLTSNDVDASIETIRGRGYRFRVQEG